MAVSGRRIDQHTRDRAAKMKERGVIISEIARRLDLSRPTVRKALEK